jgi:UDP-N-acetylmuramoylalanine--D-glutamate ligase/UDP-N-acetylenolpyruvoylglucosamine reductase
MMGVGGSGMAGIAYLAKEMGYEVTGCDLEKSTAYSDNFYHGHSVDHLKDVDLLIVTPAVFYQNPENPELLEAQKRKIVMTWQEFLGKVLLKDKKLICIAGTHGKSTVTAMAGKLLIDNRMDPIVVLGANVPGWSGSSRYGKGEYAVIEADEFNNNFLNYHPEITIINNIEFDHPDFFKNEKEVRASFDKFVKNLVGRKLLITEKDSLNKKFSLKISGNHNQKNANMVFLLGKALGIKEEAIIKSIEGFIGIERRMELIADNNGIKVYDDYAHHPTAIAATLQGIRELNPDSRIWAIVEAHGFARTAKLINLYKNVFTDADKVLVGPIFKARDKETFEMSPEVIAKKSGHPDAHGYDSFEEIIKILKKEMKSGDAVLVMGAGKSYLWARKIAEIIGSKSVIRENVNLKNLTTFKIGGSARYFAEVKNDEEILGVCNFAKKNNLKIFILGGGSDVLVNDKGFDGVVIKFIGEKLAYEEGIITAEAGLIWDKLVEYSVKNNLEGIERMSGIPGTVGASPVQNMGAYGQEVKDTLICLRAFNFETGKFIDFLNKDCEFGYRESFFKKPDNWQKYLITAVSFKLNKNAEPITKYESLSNYLKDKKISKASLKEVRDAVLTLRKEKLENPEEFGNAGSFFKNPVVEKEIEGIPSYPFGKKFKLFAGWLIDKAGWKGKTCGGAAVSSKNALFIINKSGQAKSSDVAKLANKIVESVKEKFGVTLEMEVQYIGLTKKVAILGYGLEGQDAQKYFKNLGVDVTILDKKFDEKYLENLNKFDIIVRSPGIYRYLPEIVNAEKEGVEITSALKIFFEKCPGKIIGVTGTKGKGTTSTLIYEILKNAGKDVYLVGNIGKPYLDILSKLSKDSIIVMELSSFQLIDMDRSPHIAVVLNITLDHMDWHKDKEEYINAKKNIVRHQSVSDWAVLNEEYEVSRNFAKLTKGKVEFFSKEKLESKYKEELLLRGEHNLENIAAAVSVSKIVGVDEDIILKTVRSFKGLEHRLELVGTINGVTFYNDSFATGPQPTIAAINSFTEPETLILGGSDKGLDYRQLRDEIEKRDNVKNLILIGQIGEKIGGGIKGKNIINLGKTSMIHIIDAAQRVSPKGGVVILSPAAASFDMFENYKDRGNQFKKAVQSLLQDKK